MEKNWFSPLDGLRAIAVTAVLINHSNHINHWALGNVGVVIFFSISGFLAYYVLHHDEQRLGGISYSYFLLRRVLRIWPAYFAIIAIASLIATHDARSNAIFTPLFTFTLNWKMYSFTGWPLPTLSPLWSISVEQQFYIVAPFCYQLLRSRYALTFCLTILLLSNAGRIAYVILNSQHSGNGGLYYATYAYADVFLMGSVVAHWFLAGKKISACGQWLAFLSAVILFVVISYLWGPIVFPPYVSYALLPYVLLPIAAMLLLVSIMPAKELTLFAKLLSTQPMAMLARLSYSLYLVHLLIANYVHTRLIYYPTCLAAAALLYLSAEKPFLKLKNASKRIYGNPLTVSSHHSPEEN